MVKTEKVIEVKADWLPPLLLSGKPQKRSLKYWITREKIEMMINPVCIFEVRMVYMHRIFEVNYQSSSTFVDRWNARSGGELCFVSLRNDFAKYKKRVPTLQISAALDSIVRQMGNKFVYADKEQIYSAFQIKHAVELPVMAGLAIPVTHTSANGLPLGSEINPKFRKMLLLDTGVFQRLLGLKLSDILRNTAYALRSKTSGNMTK
jgi:hypothetical protein